VLQFLTVMLTTASPVRKLDADAALAALRDLRARQPVVTADGVLRHPKFDHILSGCTSLRILDLAPALVERGLLTAVEVCDLTAAEAKAAREMVLMASSVKVQSCSGMASRLATAPPVRSRRRCCSCSSRTCGPATGW